ncbi:MAG TPA: sugar ABC transporter permease [Trueperaceae bacterium]|nr:sugar ABC transporter permease [Trueperaceae bacterium]
MLVPGLLIYAVFVVYPLLASFRFSLYNWSGVGPLSDFIGLGNFAYVFAPSRFLPYVSRAFLHNLYFFALAFVLNGALGFALAYLLSTINRRASLFFQVLYLIPYLIPPIVVGFSWSILLTPGYGPLAHLSKALHVAYLPVLGSSSLALPTVVGITTWSILGLPILIFLAAIINIPQEILDAARVDGCGSFQVATRVVFPMLRSTFFTILTLTWIGSFAVFDLVFVLEGTQAGPNYATDVFGTLFYRTAFGGFGSTAQGMGLAAAVAAVGFVFVMIISGIFVWLQRRYGDV